MNPLRWRKMTWAILAFSGLIVALGGSVIAVYVDSGADCDQAAADCSPMWAVVSAAGFWLTALFCIWFLGFIILSIVWFMSRPERRICPICGNDARKGQRRCNRCGYDFAAVASAPSITCPRCGTTGLPTSTRFCPSCGLQRTVEAG